MKVTKLHYVKCITKLLHKCNEKKKKKTQLLYLQICIIISLLLDYRNNGTIRNELIIITLFQNIFE